jgi:hypothetical protein
MGEERLVERLRISFPCTIMLSFDFLRSRVSISAGNSQREFELRFSTGRVTVSTSIQVHDVAYSDIDDAEKPLILLLEFLLIKYLYGQNAIFGDFPIRRLAGGEL